MGLYYFPSPADGVLSVLVMNTILSMVLFKNMVRSLLQIVIGDSPNLEEDQSISIYGSGIRARRVSITRFKSLCKSSNCGGNSGGGSSNLMECCVCLCGFEAEEEVSELLACKHFFHKGCLDKWFDSYHHTTCPLCRSIL